MILRNEDLDATKDTDVPAEIVNLKLRGWVEVEPDDEAEPPKATGGIAIPMTHADVDSDIVAVTDAQAALLETQGWTRAGEPVAVTPLSEAHDLTPVTPPAPDQTDPADPATPPES